MYSRSYKQIASPNWSRNKFRGLHRISDSSHSRQPGPYSKRDSKPELELEAKSKPMPCYLWRRTSWVPGIKFVSKTNPTKMAKWHSSRFDRKFIFIVSRSQLALETWSRYKPTATILEDLSLPLAVMSSACSVSVRLQIALMAQIAEDLRIVPPAVGLGVPQFREDMPPMPHALHH